MLSPGTLLQNRYEIVRLIAEGGMGAVYLARDQRLDSEVALKETLFTDERMSKAFEREARLLARLRHPALPRVSDHFIEEQGQFLIMEYIPGEDLAQIMKRRAVPFPYDDVIRWGDQLLDALEYLHSQEPPVVHRDIKPQNLKLNERGQIILLDFGLAKNSPLQMTRVTSSGSIYGFTPNYAPMEQIQGVGTDPRSDLYSLAATLYHFMAGVTPLDALTRAAAVVEGNPDPLITVGESNADVSSAVAIALHKGLALSRNQRYSSAGEMRNAMRTACEASSLPDGGETMIVGSPQRADSSIGQKGGSLTLSENAVVADVLAEQTHSSATTDLLVIEDGGAGESEFETPEAESEYEDTLGRYQAGDDETLIESPTHLQQELETLEQNHLPILEERRFLIYKLVFAWFFAILCTIGTVTLLGYVTIHSSTDLYPFVPLSVVVTAGTILYIKANSKNERALRDRLEEIEDEKE